MPNLRESLGQAIGSLRSSIQGRKTHILVVLGMVVVALNHFFSLPSWMDLGDLKPENWLQDEWKLAVGSTIRSAIAQAGSARGS